MCNLKIMMHFAILVVKDYFLHVVSKYLDIVRIFKNNIVFMSTNIFGHHTRLILTIPVRTTTFMGVPSFREALRA